jgi:prepilin-type N-terminal cleavage/methylation domain-containing protein
MYSLRKSKKGFTLIELMVVVAIIGVLSLLGLRLYSGQQEKAKSAVVKANAGTVQTLIQAELADGALSDVDTALTAIGASTAGELAGMQNPFTSTKVVVGDEAAEGVVVVTESGTSGGTYFLIRGTGKGTDQTGFDVLSAQL